MLPAGVRVPGWTVSLAGWLGLRQASATRLTVLAIAVVTVACCCLVVLLMEAWRGRATVGAVMTAVVAATTLVLAGPVLLSRDVTSYAAYGRMLALHGANPYLHAPAAFPEDPVTRAVSPEWLHTPSLYGPLFNLLSAGIAAWASVPNIPRACAAQSRAQASESRSAFINRGIHICGSAWISPSAHNALARTLLFELVAARKSNGIAGFADGPIQLNESSIALWDSTELFSL